LHASSHIHVAAIQWDFVVVHQAGATPNLIASMSKENPLNAPRIDGGMGIFADEGHSLAVCDPVVGAVHRFPYGVDDINRPKMIGQFQVHLVGNANHLPEKFDDSVPAIFARHNYQWSARVVFVKVEEAVEGIEQRGVDAGLPRGTQGLTDISASFLILAQHGLSGRLRYYHPGHQNIPLCQYLSERLEIFGRQMASCSKTRYGSSIEKYLIDSCLSTPLDNLVDIAACMYCDSQG
jgi:hypothetical protein